MSNQYIFDFKSDISDIPIPEELNNPFGVDVSDIVRVAAVELQEFILKESKKWKYDFRVRKGKMFGVLVVQKADETYGYLGTCSGKLHKETQCYKFVPPVFDDSIDDYFINRDMSELTLLCNEVKNTQDESKRKKLVEARKKKSHTIQQRLFDNYHFVNVKGEVRNILDIFKNVLSGMPPSGSGECAASKLLQYAIKQGIKPIAIAEFWWGNPTKDSERVARMFYPACESKCKPVIEFMLDDYTLFGQAHS
jgi:tRNA pseudouridine32 synthase/23S rRNA pseudouridine746 synthase